MINIIAYATAVLIYTYIVCYFHNKIRNELDYDVIAGNIQKRLNEAFEDGKTKGIVIGIQKGKERLLKDER